jgi:CO/xanthine dehydrogenase FAD-binding subunit
MIPFPLEYYRPDTLEEAAAVYVAHQQAGKSVLYYGGGTEILTEARRARLRPAVVIDLKRIPECRQLVCDGSDRVFGAALSLDELCRDSPWSLLTQACARIADHTTRSKITLGGNLAGMIPYREAALPFMLFGDQTQVEIFGPSGGRQDRLSAVFDGQLHLGNGEFLVSLKIPAAETKCPGISLKQTRIDWVDYPLFTVSLVQVDDEMHGAFSGVLDKPFRSSEMDQILSRDAPADQRAKAAVAAIHSSIIDDLHGSRDYRAFRLTKTLTDMLNQLQSLAR